uniref:Uncharacterized protein n=1 Tax=Cacopsylla melanoneura TaxID=428564 RepID=A0A8D8QD57_9HEMI
MILMSVFCNREGTFISLAMFSAALGGFIFFGSMYDVNLFSSVRIPGSNLSRETRTNDNIPISCYTLYFLGVTYERNWNCFENNLQSRIYHIVFLIIGSPAGSPLCIILRTNTPVYYIDSISHNYNTNNTQKRCQEQLHGGLRNERSCQICVRFRFHV